MTKRGETTVLTETYTYVNPSDATTSSQIATYKTETANYSITYSYTYDDNGNILTVHNGTYLTSYEYDSANQLIRENNQWRNRSYTWTYDSAGNVVSEKTYAYTTGEITDETATVSTNGYTYGDEDWGDLLTAHNGTAIEYDEIGNPLSDANRSFTWEHGRQMATQTRGDTTWTYTYDINGMRTSRSNGTKTYKYVYSGDKLVQMTVTDTSANTEQLIEFTYDAVGQPLTMTLDGTVYYYLLNIQGDVMGLVDGSGNLLVSYLYEAYGECFYITDTSDMVNTLIGANPLLYRSYLIDTGTGLYYLQSRYYDPQLGRFLNADGFASTGVGLLGNNMFTYCNNNPVIFEDISGQIPRKNTVIINDGAGGDIGPIGIISSDYYHKLHKMNMRANEVHTAGKWFDTDWPSFMTVTNEGVEVASWSLSTWSGAIYFDEEEEHSLYASVGNIGTYLGAHREHGVGAEAGVSLLSVGYDGEIVNFSFELLTLGASYMYQDGTLKSKAGAGYFGYGIAVDIPALIKTILGG